MKKASHTLAFLGAVPFVLSALLLIMQVPSLPFLGDVAHLIHSYSLAIISFMAGCHWGMHLLLNDKWQQYLPLLSNVITLSAWFSYLLLPIHISLLIMACGFAALLFIDYVLKQRNLITHTYYKVRFRVSLIVMASLVVCSAILF